MEQDEKLRLVFGYLASRQSDIMWPIGSGGKERLRRTTKMGERSLRRLLILGASSATKVAARNPDKSGAWLAGMLARKPRMLVTVAFANKLERLSFAKCCFRGAALPTSPLPRQARRVLI
jgi:hypothetical protein